MKFPIMLRSTHERVLREEAHTSNILDSITASEKLIAAAMRSATPCPKCGDVQVQLVDWAAAPPQWKCRACKHKFTTQLET